MRSNDKEAESDNIMETGLLLGIVKLLISPATQLYKSCLLYPIKIEYVSQYESSIGYIFQAKISCEEKEAVVTPKKNFQVKLQLDQEELKTVDKTKIMSGEHAEVYDSPHTLEARLKGLTFGNISKNLVVTQQPIDVWFLIMVKGPGSTNPSLRFGLGRVYLSLKFLLKRRWLWKPYADFSIYHPPILGGNSKTQILDA